MKKCKKYKFIIIPGLLLTAVTVYSLAGWGNKPLDKTADKTKVTLRTDVPKVSIELTSKKPKAHKKRDDHNHNHDYAYDYDETLAPDDPLASPSFDTMEEGVSIVSYKDQPIPQLFKDMTEKAVKEMKERGYTSVEESDVRTISKALESRFKHLLLSYEDAANQLVKEPVNLEATPFNDGELLGANTSGSNHDGKWTDISRFYKFEDLGVVKLREVDYVTSGGRIQVTEELINEDVNGIPATYLVNVSNSGAASSLVSWATDSKYYELEAEKNGAKEEGVKQRLLELARSIPVD
ncbi:hypothetical protein BPLS_P4450 [Bathymodiolus platifrons methanotrophic gill symbiont]|uniref:hypothetical protein n=1 Tax=Bathymodiolus platifrons methanotrophic gill symbiont TaxID=113268 RepID=UPI001B66E98A|nr:hypothetical protein [Bathymodiolus platifrons methanotrophic gill symbiont]GFO76577.1 hypothetical protein BPLS_P4450 [Bathymodiolus platifrons methanotrophic gill symbiont]